MHGCEQNLLQLGSAASGAQQGLQGMPLVPAAAWQLGSAASGAQQGLQGIPLVPVATWQLGSAPLRAQQGLQGMPSGSGVLTQRAQGPQVHMSCQTAHACAGLGCGFAGRAACACGVPEFGVRRLRCRLCWRWRLSPRSRRQQSSTPITTIA